MAGRGFRVTVEDLDTGDTTVMEIAQGDYVLTTFEPCYRASVQIYPLKGTHVITIKDYRPAFPARTVPPQPSASSVPLGELIARTSAEDPEFAAAVRRTEERLAREADQKRDPRHG